MQQKRKAKVITRKTRPEKEKINMVRDEQRQQQEQWREMSLKIGCGLLDSCWLAGDAFKPLLGLEIPFELKHCCASARLHAGSRKQKAAERWCSWSCMNRSPKEEHKGQAVPLNGLAQHLKWRRASSLLVEPWVFRHLRFMGQAHWAGAWWLPTTRETPCWLHMHFLYSAHAWRLATFIHVHVCCVWVCIQMHVSVHIFPCSS